MSTENSIKHEAAEAGVRRRRRRTNDSPLEQNLTPDAFIQDGEVPPPAPVGQRLI